MDFILNPFVTLLTFLYGVFNRDMVLSIAVFTILVRLLTYPLTAQQLRSSQAMQKIQPEMKKLQEKYKNDREKLAQEQMQLYRQYGINPLGGCLPLLIQFPIFIALYQAIIFALASTPTQLIDLSGRLLVPGLDRFIPLENMWLGMNLTQPPNLSSITAIVIVALTVVTTWLQFRLTMPPTPPNEDGTPNPTASMTQSMGTIMPLMYGFFALSFSVGLSIYFIVSNLAGILQYVLMGRANFSNLIPGRKPPVTPSTPTKVEGKATPTPKPKAPKSSNGTDKTPQRAGKAK